MVKFAFPVNEKAHLFILPVGYPMACGLPTRQPSSNVCPLECYT